MSTKRTSSWRLQFRLIHHTQQRYHYAAAVRRAQKNSDLLEDVVFCTVKRDYQEQGRQQVRNGQRTPQSLHFISPDLIKTAEVHFPDVSFN